MPPSNQPIAYLAFLRGINVGGHKIIKMTELAKIFSAMELENVRTYIQSGNVFFDSSEKNAATLGKHIETKLEVALGYHVPIMLRTIEELRGIIESDPFDGKKPAGDTKFYVAFLDGQPSTDARHALLKRAFDYETFHFVGREVFMTCVRDTSGKLPYTMNSLEKILGVRATIRNWETLGKMMGTVE